MNPVICMLLALIVQISDVVDKPAVFQSNKARAASTEYQKSLNVLNFQQNTGWKRLVQTLSKDLVGLRKKAIEGDNLDEAKQIAEIVKRLEGIQARGMMPLSVVSAEWRTLDQRVDVTKRVQELLALGQPLGLDSQTLQIENPSGHRDKTLTVKINPILGLIDVPDEALLSDLTRQRLAKYTDDMAALNNRGILSLTEARKTYTKELTQIRKDLIKADNLDEAMVVAEEIKAMADTPTWLPFQIEVKSAEWGVGGKGLDVAPQAWRLLYAGETVRADGDVFQVPDPAVGTVKILRMQLNIANIPVTIIAPDFHGIRLEIGTVQPPQGDSPLHALISR